MLDGVLADHLDAPDLEFTWVGDDAVDPLQQAQTLSILVNAGIKTREEARADLGLTGEGAGAPGAADALGKFNPYHDPSNWQFTTAQGGGSDDGESAQLVNITCDHLFELDRAICVTLGDDDPWLLKHCMKNAIARFSACLAGEDIPNLVSGGETV